MEVKFQGLPEFIDIDRAWSISELSKYLLRREKLVQCLNQLPYHLGPNHDMTNPDGSTVRVNEILSASRDFLISTMPVISWKRKFVLTTSETWKISNFYIEIQDLTDKNRVKSHLSILIKTHEHAVAESVHVHLVNRFLRIHRENRVKTVKRFVEEPKIRDIVELNKQYSNKTRKQNFDFLWKRPAAH